MTNKSPLTIGALAQSAGLNVETIRFYERKGLIEQPPKPPTGFRRYPSGTVARLSFIKSAKQLGFSLKEIADLLALQDSDCQQAREIAVEKLTDIRSRIERLEHMRDALEKLVRACDENAGGNEACAIIQALVEGGEG